MTDVFTPAARAAVMRAVKSRGTRPELRVRRIAHRLRRGYRLNVRDLPGAPDLAYRRLRKAVFVHGCFWHGHGCARGARAPKANAAYWAAKIARTRLRDDAALDALQAAGWSTLVVWECALADEPAVAAALSAFLCDVPSAQA